MPSTTTTTTAAASKKEASPFGLRQCSHGEERPHLACMNCVSCCGPAPLSAEAREESALRWEKEERARGESIRRSQELYCREAEEAVFSNDARGCGKKLALILPLIVMRGDGTLVQYDPPQKQQQQQASRSPRREEDASSPSSSPGSFSPSDKEKDGRQGGAKVTLNGIYRDSWDSVCFHQQQASRRRKRRGDRRRDREGDDLVGVLGLLSVEASALRRRRGAEALASVLLPLKMTNVSITAKVEEATEEDLARALRESREETSARDYLLRDEFSCQAPRPTFNLNPQQAQREKHARSWSWDSCFSSSSSFKDFPLASSATPPPTPTMVGGSQAHQAHTGSLPPQQQQKQGPSLATSVCSLMTSAKVGHVCEKIKRSLYVPLPTLGSAPKGIKTT